MCLRFGWITWVVYTKRRHRILKLAHATLKNPDAYLGLVALVTRPGCGGASEDRGAYHIISSVENLLNNKTGMLKFVVYGVLGLGMRELREKKQS